MFKGVINQDRYDLGQGRMCLLPKVPVKTSGRATHRTQKIFAECRSNEKESDQLCRSWSLRDCDAYWIFVDGGGEGDSQDVIGERLGRDKYRGIDLVVKHRPYR